MVVDNSNGLKLIGKKLDEIFELNFLSKFQNASKVPNVLIQVEVNNSNVKCNYFEKVTMEFFRFNCGYYITFSTARIYCWKIILL